MLTSKKIEALKPREKRFTISDGHGLTLRVYPSGSKTWVFRHCANGRIADIRLGKYPEMSLKEARQVTRRKRKEFNQEPPKGYVFADAFKLWCNQKKGRIVSYENEKRMLERHLLHAISMRQIDEITAPLIVHITKPLATSGKQVTLKRVVMRCREILDLAVAAGFIQHNPIDRLNKIFPTPDVEPMPSIDWRELTEAMTVIAGATRKIQVVFLFSLCSLLRPNEVAKLRWEWIEQDMITIPASEMKKRRAHRVPLTPELLYLLGEAKAISKHQRSGFVFSGCNGAKSMSSQTLAKYLHSTKLKGRLVAHGLRSIGRSWMADHNILYEVAEACLAHLSGSAVSRAYQRSDFLDERRIALKKWNSFVFDCARCAQIKTN